MSGPLAGDGSPSGWLVTAARVAAAARLATAASGGLATATSARLAIHMPDPAGFIRQLRAAVTIDGNTGSLSGSPTFAHPPYTITVLNVRSLEDYQLGEPTAVEHPKDKSEGYVMATLFVSFDKISNSSHSVVVRNAENKLQLLRERGRILIRLPLPRKP